MVSQYLGMVFSGWFSHHSEPPKRLDEYYERAKWIGRNASEKSDLAFLKVA